MELVLSNTLLTKTTKHKIFWLCSASVYPYSQFLPKGEWSIGGSARAACAKNACGKLHYPTVGGAVGIILHRGPSVNNTGPSIKFMYTAPPSGVTSSGSCRNSDCRNFNFVYFFIWSLTLKGEKLRIGIKTGWPKQTILSFHHFQFWNQNLVEFDLSEEIPATVKHDHAWIRRYLLTITNVSSVIQ